MDSSAAVQAVPPPGSGDVATDRASPQNTAPSADRGAAGGALEPGGRELGLEDGLQRFAHSASWLSPEEPPPVSAAPPHRVAKLHPPMRRTEVASVSMIRTIEDAAVQGKAAKLCVVALRPVARLCPVTRHAPAACTA